MTRAPIILTCIALAGCVAEDPGFPSREALTIPQAPAPPLRDGLIEDPLWATALEWTGEFHIAGDDVVGGAFPHRLLVAGDAMSLYVGVVVDGLTENSYYGQIDDATGIAPEGLKVLLTQRPHFGGPSDVLFVDNFRSYGTVTEDGFWDGKGWISQLDASFCPDGVPGPTCRTARTSASNDVLTWEIAIGRGSAYVECDGFQAHDRAAFGLRLVLERQGDPRTDKMFLDHFPRTGPPPGELARMDDWLWLAFPEPAAAPPPAREDCRAGTH